MSLMDRVATYQNRFYDRIRHRDAASVTDGPATAGDFSALEGHKYCLITSYRRDGSGVPTPVWLGAADGKLYLPTWADSAKVRRIRANPRVRITPCTTRGKPTGPTAEGSARIVDRTQEEHAERAIQANYGPGRKVYEGAIDAANASLVYIEVAPGSPPAGEGG